MYCWCFFPWFAFAVHLHYISNSLLTVYYWKHFIFRVHCKQGWTLFSCSRKYNNVWMCGDQIWWKQSFLQRTFWLFNIMDFSHYYIFFYLCFSCCHRSKSLSVLIDGSLKALRTLTEIVTDAGLNLFADFVKTWLVSLFFNLSSGCRAALT